ncbi:unnamed protein product [Caenorhabditis angaria]|uniref:Saposin B-type domain-containing protein n=1 Tax=Caenorhabditis angaria TaxID=860376 RepID=A0A9P1IR77_9PELO|nr:unnamed protein product [Caenorhabditis angaria]
MKILIFLAFLMAVNTVKCGVLCNVCIGYMDKLFAELLVVDADAKSVLDVACDSFAKLSQGIEATCKQNVESELDQIVTALNKFDSNTICQMIKLC